MISGLDHVHILCGDVEASVKYFEDIFEGKVESRGESRGFPMIRIDVKGVPINLMGTDPKAGVLGGAADLTKLLVFNHYMEVIGGVLADEAGALLSAFFRERRQDLRNRGEVPKRP